MTLMQKLPKYTCGHTHSAQAYDLADNHSQALCWAATSCPCPQCCLQTLDELNFHPEVYVNLQQLSPGMAAFVIEVSDVNPPLDSVLVLTGYARRAPSADELTPGGVAVDLSTAVWRKEYWFANETEPTHVIVLLRYLKQEIHWLETYLPKGEDGIYFAGFVPTD